MVVLLSGLSASIGASTHGRGWNGHGRACGAAVWYMDLANLYTRGQTFPYIPDLSKSPGVGVRLALLVLPGCSASLEPSQDSPGLRFSLPPCGCSLLRLLQYGRH